MTWQDDCAAAGGAAVVFPYAVPLNEIFPELPNLASTVTVPGFPACRVTNSDGSLSYNMPNLSLADRYSIVQDTLGDEAMASLVGPLDAISNAASAITSPIMWAIGLSAAAFFLYLFLTVRKKT